MLLITAGCEPNYPPQDNIVTLNLELEIEKPLSEKTNNDKNRKRDKHRKYKRGIDGSIGR